MTHKFNTQAGAGRLFLFNIICPVFPQKIAVCSCFLPAAGAWIFRAGAAGRLFPGRCAAEPPLFGGPRKAAPEGWQLKNYACWLTFFTELISAFTFLKENCEFMSNNSIFWAHLGVFYKNLTKLMAKKILKTLT